VTRQIKVGDVLIGGSAPIAIQSMSTFSPADTEYAAAQINALDEAGADIVRLAVPDKKAAELLSSDKIIREGTRNGQYLTQRRLSDISSKVGISIPVVLGILQHAKIIEWRKFAKCRQPVKDMIPADLIMG